MNAPISKTCGIHQRLPERDGRIAEGGRRLAGEAGTQEPGSGPRVSIITVTYNAAATLAQCIASVTAQTWSNIEYIVVDGASSDGTVEIIRQHAAVIDYFVSEPDDGIYNAMNKGLSLASGEYILLLNADDWYREDAVETLVGAAQAARADVAHADAITVDDRGKKTGTIEGPAHDGMYTAGSRVRHETMLVRRETYDRFGGYDESWRILADHVYTMRLFEAGCRFEHAREFLLYFRVTGISNTAQDLRSEERQRLFRERFPFLAPTDVERLARGRLSNREMLTLINRYAGENELFARSLANNIAQSPSFKLAETLFEPFAARIRHTRVWESLRPAKRWVYRTLFRQ